MWFECEENKQFNSEIFLRGLHNSIYIFVPQQKFNKFVYQKAFKRTYHTSFLTTQ